MSTGKDYGLPEEYAEWVETSGLEIHIDTPDYLHLIARRFKHGPLNTGSVISDRYYIPPKPKPTLPEVEEGAVIRFRSKAGSIRRAIRGRFNWRVFEKGTPVVYHGTDFADPTATDAYLLNDVDDDGFTVELGGLE